MAWLSTQSHEIQVFILQAAWLREVDPTQKGFWQRVARLVPGGKTAEECHSAYMAQFGATPAEKPRLRQASQKAAASSKGMPSMHSNCVTLCRDIQGLLHRPASGVSITQKNYW